MLKKIGTIAVAALIAISLAACNPAAKAGDGMNGKAYDRQSFDGASVQNGLNPAVNSAGELVTASQASGRPVVLTTWDADGKQKGSITTDITDQASMFALNSKDEPYILAAPQGGQPTVHVLDASGKTSRTIPLDIPQPQGMIQTQTGPSGQSSSGNAKNGQGSSSGDRASISMASMVLGMQPAPDGGVFVSALGTGVMQFDPSGKQVRTIGSGGMAAGYIALNEKGQLIVYSMGGGGASLKTYDAASGNAVSETDTSAMSQVQMLFYDKIGKRLLFMTGSDIRQLSADGKTSTALATFNDFNLIDGMRQIYSFATDGKGTIWLSAYNPSDASVSEGSGASMQNGGGAPVIRNGGVNEMIRLALVDASTLQAKKTLKVAAINGSQTLNLIISAFQKEHPDYKVDLKVYNTQAVGMNVIVGPGVRVASKQVGSAQQDNTSFIQAPNTDIMSGDGPDIIVLDGLPWYDYLDKGLLADLGQLMADKKFDTSQYYSNIFDACKVGGRLYCVPASFSYTVLSGKTAYMPDSANPTLDDFMAKARALPSGLSAFGNQDATQIFLNYIQYCYREMVDTAGRKANFDSPEFIQAMMDFRELIGENTSSDNNQDSTAAQINGTAAYNAVTMNNPMQLSMQRAILGDDMKLTNIPTFSGSGANLFSASLMLGINANTKAMGAAWNFVQAMLSPDIQGGNTASGIKQMGMEGFPVLKAAAQQLIDDIHTGSTLGNMRAVISIGDKQVEAKPLTDADCQLILDTLPKLDTLQYADLNVLKILGEELPTFFSGQKPAEEVASLIQNRVNTLLNE